ncbi:tyrosine-type recombinase/integrase [Paenibacillus andongensis]|uniref:tyrosine-type recombinase/integrase n=1 Tax=Paenibacillus andongensis TaxID=2975482 RepID=UPI0021BB0DB1|nr:site-specific integrase [Paenibacillus andongensis]
MQSKLSPKGSNKDFSSRLKYLLINKIDQLGDFNFSDDSWYYIKNHKNALPKGCYTITFYQAPDSYKEWVKYYALYCTATPITIKKKCYKISLFLKFLEEKYNSKDLSKVTRKIVNAFEFELRLSDASETTKQFTYASLQEFFIMLSDFPEMPNVIPTKHQNPFKQSNNQSDRRLPAKVLRTLDKIMKDDSVNIPLELRTVYWLIRSFPNRITEVLSLKRDCLKSFYSEYVIQMPTFKSTGNYGREETKPIPVVYSGHGKYVIDLIRKLQEQTEGYLKLYPKYDHINKDRLFTVRVWSFFDDGGCLGVKYYDMGRTAYRYPIRNLTSEHINDYFADLAIKINIRNENNSLIQPTTHQFRHHAVSDRLYTVGYTIEQVRKLTGHKNEAMTKKYTHQMIEKHKEIHLGLAELRHPNESAFEFKGKIINLDERTVAHLSKDQRRYLTWEANGKKGVGICSDISGCNPKGTSVHFECYACDWFVPKLEYYEDYKSEHAYWMNVIDRTANKPQRSAHFENAVRNVSYLERIIDVCKNGLEQYTEGLIDNISSKIPNLIPWE